LQEILKFGDDLLLIEEHPPPRAERRYRAALAVHAVERADPQRHKVHAEGTVKAPGPDRAEEVCVLHTVPVLSVPKR